MEALRKKDTIHIFDKIYPDLLWSLAEIDGGAKNVYFINR